MERSLKLVSTKIGFNPACITGFTVVGQVKDGTIISSVCFHL